MKILITGAHFTTALATVEELKKNNIDIVYVGRRTTREGDTTQSIESQILPQVGVKFISITSGRLQRAFTFYTIPSLFKIPLGFIQAFLILFKEKPAVVLSFGGYVSVPVVVMAWLFSIPVIIHEQTLITGLANKISSWFADKIAVSFPESELIKNEKAILTGNPIRREITQGVYSTHLQGVQKNTRVPTILITGGNQGSHVINQATEGCLDKLIKVTNVIHQTGDSKFRDYERLSLGFARDREVRGSDRYTVMKWIPQIGKVMKKVDLVVSRSGINTLTELAFLGKPTLVIPIPYLYQNEQTKNAKYFANLGLVRILPQSKLSSDSLLKEIKSGLSNLKSWQRSAKKAKSAVIPDAAKRLALETILLAKELV